jgi:hypothetical protein
MREGDGIYWINGKAGSGKSTLMKYIFDDPRTTNLVKEGREKNACVAGFFFHDRGSTLQKSLVGLLRAILIQIFKIFPTLIRAIMPAYSKVEWDMMLRQWSERDLIEVFRTVARQTEATGILCLIIDGLDEFEGEDATIADFLCSLVEQSEDKKLIVKACVSSRPHNVFKDIFGGCAGFRLQDWTKVDVEEYVTGRFQRVTRSSSLSGGLQHMRVEPLKLMILHRASGVFLWVRLVVDDLLQGLTDGDPFDDLKARLDSLPDDLEGLYHRMLKRVPRRYITETALIFKIVQHAEKPLSVFELSEAMKPIDRLRTRTSNTDEIVSDSEMMQRRMISRCGGLLEVVPGGRGSRLPGLIDQSCRCWTNTVVQFLHQTVKEFLESAGVWHDVFASDGTEPASKAIRNLLAASLANAKAIHGMKQPPYETLQNALQDCGFLFLYRILSHSNAESPYFFLGLFYAKEAQNTLHEGCIDLLDEMDSTFTALTRSSCHQCVGVHWSHYLDHAQRQSNFVEYAARKGLTFYAKEKGWVP